MGIKKIYSLKTFRIYKGENSIDLSSTDNKNIFVISGRNGFGKTTFLYVISLVFIWAQMGDVDELYQKEIQIRVGYNKVSLEIALNRYSVAHGEEDFHVAITITDAIIPELPCKEIKIQRTHHRRSGDTYKDLYR